MKVSALPCAAILGLTLADCATPPSPPPPQAADAGSMAFPSPQPQGDVGTIQVR